jgi:glycosyltransferase involved in cell wall biosynthesis
MQERLALSIVCPAYQEEDVLPLFHERLAAVVTQLEREFTVEIIYVDDGSTDGTVGVLRELARRDPRVGYLSLSRNFGHQAALTAGLEHARGDLIVSLDSDLQHPPEVIPQLIECWREGHEVVLTERIDSGDAGWFKRLSSRAYYRVLNRLSEATIKPAAADFRLLSRPALDALLKLRESNRFLRGLVSWIGFRPGCVRFQAAPRAAGRSRYTLRRMLRLACDGLLSFSLAPLWLPTWLGLAAFAAAGVDLLAVALRLLWGGPINWTGQATLLAVLLTGGSTLFSLGILGAYLGRVFEQVKRRPLYLVREQSPQLAPPQQTRDAA